MVADPAMLAESHAVLVGVSAYEYAEFPPIRAARNSLKAMRSLLSDPALCAWPAERITVIANPVSAADLATTIADLAESTAGALLLYYVGHGVLSAHGELCLTVTSTRPDRPKISGLPWDTLADVLRSCPARTRLAILDCCFAGQAVEALTGGGGPGLADLVHVEGVYTLTATTRNHAAHVPPPGQQDTVCTSFTGELRDLIRSGIPGKAPQLTFSDIYPVLQQRLRAKGLPVPSQHGTDTARQFPFTANAAVPAEPRGQGAPAEDQGSPAAAQNDTEPGPGGAEPAQGGAESAQDGAEPARSGPSPHADIVTGALRATHSITDAGAKARALVAVAQALEATDPERSGRLIADAERVAEAISEPATKASALADVAGPLATIAPDRAEHAAGSITDESLKARALAGVAGALAGTDPERSGRLFADAERIARAIPSAPKKASALAGVAEALAASDADHAERVAHSITEPMLAAAVLTTLARSVAEPDPDRAGRLVADAERIAQSITGASFRAPATAAVAEGLAAIDPGHAERVAQSITSADSRAVALAAVAKTQS
jgi:Caspase domain